MPVSMRPPATRSQHWLFTRDKLLSEDLVHRLFIQLELTEQTPIAHY